MNRNRTNTNNRGRNEYRSKYNSITYSEDVASAPEHEGSVQESIALKARSGLYQSSLSVKADPYTAALPGSAPYPIVARFNRMASPTYKGDANLDGGNIQQYSYGNMSALLKAFDYMYMRLNINYLYQPMNPNDATGDDWPGKGLIDEHRRVLSEAVSILGATTFTQLAINNYAIETDLPMGSATTEQVTDTQGANPKPLYTNLTDVLYAYTTMYQLCLQAMRKSLSSYNAFKLKQGTMIRNAFQREVPQLNSLFGLFNKKSFMSVLQSLALSFSGEYMDVKFLKTVDMLTTMPSRRSNSILDPLLELGIGFSHPTKFKIYILDADGNYLKDTIDLMEQVTIDGQSIFDMQITIENAFAAEDTAYWARTTAYSQVFANSRFNAVKAIYDNINTAMTNFKIVVADLREAMDVLARGGYISWSKGFTPAITTLEDCALFQNDMIDDIFKNAMSGARDVTFSERTKRWATFTMWSMYNGIPEYDRYSGGAFLTYSFKQFITPQTDVDKTINYLPKMFSGQKDGTYDVYCYICSRDGKQYQVTRGAGTTISSNEILARLAPLPSQSKEVMRIPSVDVGEDGKAYASLVYKVLTSVFGACAVTSAGKTDYALDPDIIAIYQIEIEDITNEAISFARYNCVISGSGHNPGVIGFSGT